MNKNDLSKFKKMKTRFTSCAVGYDFARQLNLTPYRLKEYSKKHNLPKESNNFCTFCVGESTQKLRIADLNTQINCKKTGFY